jgi:hypothetical protein
MAHSKKALFLMMLSTTLASGQFTDVINSNRPGESMAAFSVGQTIIQAELGLDYVNETFNDLDYEANGFRGDLAVRYGAFFEQLELIAELQYQNDKYESPILNERRSGLRQTTFGAKYLFYDPDKNYVRKPNLYSWKANHRFQWRELIPAVGVYAGFNLQIGDNPYALPEDEKFSPKLMVLTQNQFGKWVFVTNLIADKIATNPMTLGYIVTLTRGFSPRWSGFLENQGYKSDYYKDAIFRVGAAFLLWENIQIDASVGKNIKATPELLTAGIGVSWRFDDNYEDVYLRAPKDEKEKDKDKEKKKKDKKKRKDGIETDPAAEPVPQP